MCNRTVGFCHGCGRPDSELVGTTALCRCCYISLCEQAATATAEWYREAEWPERWSEADANNPEG